MKKTYLIFGFEKSGQSALELIYNKKDLFYIYDENENIKITAQEKAKHFLNVFVISNLEKKLLKNVSTIILSPGVSVYHWAIKYAKRNKVEVISELELGFRFVKYSKLIAITGTNGKTTTTRLVEDILKKAKKNVVACGNIGLPLTKAVKTAKKNSYFVCEVSSFQLEAIKSFKPKVACILNITPDHLNRHKTFITYKKTKFKILKNLDKKCSFVLNGKLKFSATKKPYKVYFFDKKFKQNCCYEQDENIIFKNLNKKITVMNRKDIPIIGTHNIQNIMCAITVCKILKIKNKYIQSAIKNFKLNSHRLENIYTYKNINFYDDSKATNIDATICAINSFNNLTILILGGSDKGYSYDEIFKSLPNHIQHVLCCGQVKQKLNASANKFNKKVEIFDTLKQATVRACELANLYDNLPVNVLFSPASASFDEFKNYKERGEKFFEYIKGFYERTN